MAKRIAFLTPTFATENANGGGLASYLNRMTRALVARGHEVEVFVLSDHRPGMIHHGGVRVERVNGKPRGWLGLGRALRLWRAPAEIMAGAKSLAAALEKRESEQGFDLVQSSDYFAPGRYVPARAGRVHAVRSSCARELMGQVDQGDSARTRYWWTKFESEAVGAAEVAYAPSEFVAKYYRERLGREVKVVRPPGEVIDLNLARVDGVELPAKYLLHFGQLRPYKGTAWLLDALEAAWREERELTVVMAGPVRDSALRRRLEQMKGERRLVMMENLERGEMFGVIQRSEATVLPSLADNLPNTVIESLALGVPVIGGRGASVDELVEEGVTGELAALGDVAGLARLMVRAWRGEMVRKGFVWRSAVQEQMEPGRAVQALGEAVGVAL